MAASSLAILFLLFGVTVGQLDFDPLQYVNPLIGSSNGGNVFAGATIPYGMAKAVADVDSGSNQGGFSLDSGNVTGFSSMHDSGTGGQPSLGNFPLFAYLSCPDDDIERCVFPKEARKAKYKNAVASPGYFEVELEPDSSDARPGEVNTRTVMMTSSQHASLVRFSFSNAIRNNSSGHYDPVQRAQAALVLLDLTDLSDSRQDNATIKVDGETGRMTGSARFKPSFGSGDYTLHFCVDFEHTSHAGIRQSGIWVDSRPSFDVQELTVSRGINGKPLPAGGWVSFEPVSGGLFSVYARVANSFISPEQACQYAESEMPDFHKPSGGAFDTFERVNITAASLWRDKLSAIRVNITGVDPSFVTNFYSGIYRTMVNPQDYTGENPLWKSDEPYFDSFYCLWDSFRSQLPLLTIIDPFNVARMVRSLIDTYKNLGWLPDCRMSLCKGFTQGGSNADNVLADALLKGVTEQIDWNLGYDAVVKDAEEEPFDWSSNGRGGLNSWKTLDYIPVQDLDFKGFGTLTRSISRTLEYAYNDYVISQMAHRLKVSGNDEEKYLSRSGNWRNLFKEDQKSSLNGSDTGFDGFFQPKYLNGTWGFQDPLKCSNIDTSGSQCSLTNDGPETFESSIWEYSFFVPHDQAGLMTEFGGPKKFVDRLDYMHDQNITYIGNEPSFLTVFQYHYAGRPALSAKRSHFYIPRYFSPTPAGLPGNDDSGAMGSFLAFSMMGLFPNPGQDVYLITPPYFPEVNITSHDKTATIRVINFDPTYRNVSIQSVKRDGKEYTKNWIDHSFFLNGGLLEITVGSKESGWGTKVADLPPSLSDYVGFREQGNSTANGTFKGLQSLNAKRSMVSGGMPIENVG